MYYNNKIIIITKNLITVKNNYLRIYVGGIFAEVKYEISIKIILLLNVSVTTHCRRSQGLMTAIIPPI